MQVSRRDLEIGQSKVNEMCTVFLVESMSLHTSFPPDEEDVVRRGRKAGQEWAGDMASRTNEKPIDKQISEISGEETEDEGDCVDVVFVPFLDDLGPLILNPFQVHGDGVCDSEGWSPHGGKGGG